jgi:signal transduction histidine kinase
MMAPGIEEAGMRVQVRVGGKDRVIEVSDTRVQQLGNARHAIWTGPFTRRAWQELLFFVVSALVTALGLALFAVTTLAGTALAITFLGLAILAAGLRGARGIGGWQRALARSLLNEQVDEPEPFSARPGFVGWLHGSLKDRVAWRSILYTLAKGPLVFFSGWFALSVWVDAFSCLFYPLIRAGAVRPGEFGIVFNLFHPGYLSVGTSGFGHGLFIVLTGVILLFIAPWPMRLVLFVDRKLMHALLTPDPVAKRVRSLEEARAHTVDSSAATLRRIERDLHDGTQAQLVAVAMRLGQAKEKLADGAELDLDQVRRLVDDAHQGAKDAIVELRDLARGIHPPVLDTGLEGALSTLTARSTVPTQLTVVIDDRPTPAIEAIAYFVVAELLANVAQHAEASKAEVTCTEHGRWLRVVVRDDGKGGAQPSTVGSASSGLRGLADRVRTVDGWLHLTSPAGGPTVITVDLPLHA